MKLTFVTVVFEPEFGLLKLQARSLALYVPEENVEQIIVIFNSDRKRSLNRLERMRSDYGSLAHKIRFLSKGQISSMAAAEGWIAQQILKLEISRHVTSDFYLVLDAKTHLIRPLDQGFVMSPCGKPYIVAYPYEGHGLLARLEVSLSYLGLDARDHVGRFTTSVPPFTIYTRDAVDLLDHIESASNLPFAAAFVKHDLTEFFLYTSWIIRRYGSYEARYTVHNRATTTIWEHRTDPPTVSLDIKTGSDSPFMAIHRRAFAKLPRKSVKIIAELWAGSGLFGNSMWAQLYIRKFQLGYFLPFFREYALRKVRQTRSRL